MNLRTTDLQHSTYESGIKVVTPHVLKQDLFEEDLDTLAPYIPMDGEDFPLSPISDMVEDLTETRPQESLFMFPYQETESWGWPGCPSPNPAPPLHRPLTPFAPPQRQPAVISHYSSLQTHVLKGSPYW